MKKFHLLLWASIAWLVFVVALAIWWMIFSLKIISRLQEFVGDGSLQSQHDMLLMEGSVLIVLLFGGGTALIYFVMREKRRFDEVRLFFTTFTHDMKTSITRLLLQSEELASKTSSEGIKSFQKNIIGLEFQLENSLNLAQFYRRKMHVEKVELKSLAMRLHQYWPSIKITLNNSTPIFTDAVGLESILRNVISNAMVHSNADEFKLRLEIKKDSYRIEITDNGKPTDFDFSRAGYSISPSTSGTGIGLYLIRQWVKKLEGEIQFSKVDNSSVCVVLELPVGSPS